MFESYGFQGSISQKKTCGIYSSFNNVSIEKFSGGAHCSAIKYERIHHPNYRTKEEVKADIIKDIELFYNSREFKKD